MWDIVLLGAIYSATKYAEAYIQTLDYPHPSLYHLAWVSLWALYSYAAGLVATGIWVIAHGMSNFNFGNSRPCQLTTSFDSPQNAVTRLSQSLNSLTTPWAGSSTLRKSAILSASFCVTHPRPRPPFFFIVSESHTTHGALATPSIMLALAT